jgi:N-acetyl-1-D-myo-inositol-2-amino-2-deoxy-alpha-D-glucopyranoside deacetylase
MTENKTLLAVLAHPDDESFGPGGTLALYARGGVDVYLICATRGEVGEMSADMMDGFNTIGEKRESELRCAAEILGLKSVFFLGYRDSGMPGTVDNNHPQALAAQPLDNVAGEVARYIRLLKPQVVITFDPIGGYYHPDHIAIHKATVRAFAMAGDTTLPIDELAAYSPNRLYFHTMPHAMLRMAVRLMRFFGKDPHKFGTNQDIDMAAIAEVEFPINARINCREVSEIRDAASACHASQGGTSMSSGIVGWLRKLLTPMEEYMRAFPPVNEKHIERDLFEGIQ